MSMFPHTITLIRKSDYSSSIISGVYYYGANTRKLNDTSMDKGNSINIVVPINKDVFNVGDMIIKGSVTLPTITSVAQLEDYNYVTVVSKSVYDVGSNIDNVVLVCQ